MAYTIKDLRGLDASAVNNFEHQPKASAPQQKQIAQMIVPQDREFRYLPRNPDEIFQNRNSNEIYNEMRRDYQIKSLLQVKKNIILGEGFDIELPKDNDGNPISEAQEIVDCLHQSLNNWYDGNFMDDVGDLLSAMIYGFSLSEIMWTVHEGK